MGMRGEGRGYVDSSGDPNGIHAGAARVAASVRLHCS